MGSSVWPLSPRMRIAALVCWMGSGTRRIASAIAAKAASGLMARRSCVDKPSCRTAVTALCSPPNRFFDISAIASVTRPMSVPDCLAAKP